MVASRLVRCHPHSHDKQFSTRAHGAATALIEHTFLVSLLVTRPFRVALRLWNYPVFVTSSTRSPPHRSPRTPCTSSQTYRHSGSGSMQLRSSCKPLSLDRPSVVLSNLASWAMMLNDVRPGLPRSQAFMCLWACAITFGSLLASGAPKKKKRGNCFGGHSTVVIRSTELTTHN